MHSPRIAVDAAAGAVVAAVVAGKQAVPVQADNSRTGHQDGEFAKERVGLEE